MKTLLALFALLASSSCLAAFDVTATMPTTNGATSCQLYMDGVAVGSAGSCGSANQYPSLIANPGVYLFKYKAINASGESNFSPETTVSIQVVPPPEDPLQAPSVTVTCNPSPCNVVVTVTP